MASMSVLPSVVDTVSAGPVVLACGLVRTYSLAGVQVPALRGVDLEVSAGEIVVLMGPSGCGKTTLLHLLAGLDAPDAGDLTVAGVDLCRAGQAALDRFRRDHVGVMLQSDNLISTATAREQVALQLLARGAGWRDALRSAELALAAVGLSHRLRHRPADLSGGEQQRVALARALAPGPRLLMLDEPLGALDRALRERLMLDVRAILKRLGMTAVYVTHDQTEAFAVADRLAVMNAGRIEQLGAPPAVYERPATPFVARFLGFENLLSGQADGAGTVTTAAGRFRPTAPPGAPGAVTLLIKPVLEQVAMANETAEVGDVNTITGVVDAVAFRGRFCQVWLMAGGERLLFEVSGVFDYQAGDSIRIAISPDRLLLYES